MTNIIFRENNQLKVKRKPRNRLPKQPHKEANKQRRYIELEMARNGPKEEQRIS